MISEYLFSEASPLFEFWWVYHGMSPIAVKLYNSNDIFHHFKCTRLFKTNDIVSINVLLKFQVLISEIRQYFCRKNVISFCIKASLIFFNKKLSVYLDIKW